MRKCCFPRPHLLHGSDRTPDEMTLGTRKIRIQRRNIPTRSFRAGRIEKSAHGRDAVGGKAHAAGMFLDGCLVRREVDTVHFVSGDIAVEPLDPGHSLQYVDRPLRNFPQLSITKISGSRDFPFDDVFRHQHPQLAETSTRSRRLQARLGPSYRVRRQCAELE